MARTLEHERREPAPGVLRLTLPLPFPGLNEVNAYVLVDPAGCVLVDCGIWFPDAADDHGWDHLVAALDAVDLTPGDIRRLVLTHTHIDHYGMAGRLHEETGCEVLFHSAGKAELDLIRDPEGSTARLRDVYAQNGLSGEEVGEITAYEDWRGFVHSVVEADRWLDDGEHLGVGGRSWQVVHTPGHARSHICLFSEQDNLLISGDHLLPSVTPHIDFRGGADDPLGDFLESLERVEHLGAQIVLPGHGHPFEDAAERARVTARHHDRRLGAILQVVRRKACSANEITQDIFGSALLDFQKRLALGEALAHIHYLRLRGEVEMDVAEDGTRMYLKASRRRAATTDDPDPEDRDG